MAALLGWRVLVVATVALQDPADGLTADYAALDRGAREAQQPQGELRLRAIRPDQKVARRRAFRKAPRASEAERAKIAKEMAEWLSDAKKMEKSLDEKYTSADSELVGQLLDITNEEGADDTPTLSQAERELRTLRRIWDKYNLGNENVTTVDILEKLDGSKLYPSKEAWYGDAVRRLHNLNRTESHEVAVRLREEVERLKVELEHLRDELRAEKALRVAEEAEQDQITANVMNVSSGAGEEHESGGSSDGTLTTASA